MLFQSNVSAETKQSRLDELMRIQERIASEINESKVGKILKVIIDREEPDFYIGRTEYDSPEVDPEVLIGKKLKLEPGKFYQVKIIASQSYDLQGILAN